MEATDASACPDPATQARTPKVFGIGLSRTGTNSLHAALEILGFSCIHYPRFDRLDELLALHDAAVDTPISCVFRELDASYPGSRFILTTREIESWLESTRLFFKKPIPQEPWRQEVRLKTYATLSWDRHAFLVAYQDHLANVEAHFRHRPGALLIFDITAGDGWEPLCRFLQKPVPLIPFPHKHARPVRRRPAAGPSAAADPGLELHIRS